MKTRGLIILGLSLQVCFMLFIMVQAPEPLAAIRVGIEQMEDGKTAQTPTIDLAQEGTWTIRTAGDWFLVAENWFRSIIRATMSFALASVVISVLLLFSTRNKEGATNGKAK